MRRIGDLFPVLHSFDNLLSAYRKARRGSRKNKENTAFFFHLEKELLLLQTELKAGVWVPRPVRQFEIFDPKQRTISVAAFRDRVVHHALVNLLEPLYERCFCFDSYATRKGKGVHAAVRRAQSFLVQNNWFLKSDVEKYFDSIDHNLLLQLLSRKIKDKPFLALCETVIRANNDTGKGLPIGNRTSQFFANVYLTPLDYFVQQTLKPSGYVRYMDDFVLFSNDKHLLKKMKSHTEAFLRDRLQLSLKPSATFFNQRMNGLSFLGTRIFPALIRLRKQNLRRIVQRIGTREWQFTSGRLEEVVFLQSMNSYWAMLSHYPGLRPLRRSLLDEDI